MADLKSPTAAGSAEAEGDTPSAATALQWAEITDENGRRVHLGVILAAGPDWVEVSAPDKLRISGVMRVRFLPSRADYRVASCWRTSLARGFFYTDGGPPEGHFAGLDGLYDQRPWRLLKDRFNEP